MKRNKKQNKFDIFKLLSIVLILIFLLLTPIAVQKLITIRKIICTSQYGECPAGIENDLKTLELKDYWLVKKVIAKKLDSNFLVENYLAQYQLPSTVNVSVSVKKPKYALKERNKNIFYLIDKEGTVLEINTENNLPFVEEEPLTLNAGQKISEKEKNALEILERVTWLYSVNNGLIEKEELKITLKEGVLVRFPLDSERDVLVGALRLIFSRLNDGSQGIRMEDVKEIDLRFKNPILR